MPPLQPGWRSQPGLLRASAFQAAAAARAVRPAGTGAGARRAARAGKRSGCHQHWGRFRRRSFAFLSSHRLLAKAPCRPGSPASGAPVVIGKGDPETDRTPHRQAVRRGFVPDVATGHPWQPPRNAFKHSFRQSERQVMVWATSFLGRTGQGTATSDGVRRVVRSAHLAGERSRPRRRARHCGQASGSGWCCAARPGAGIQMVVGSATQRDCSRRRRARGLRNAWGYGFCDGFVSAMKACGAKLRATSGAG